MPNCFMLIGIPGSGKSTWARNYLKSVPHQQWVLVSSDDFIEIAAMQSGKTYTEVFSEHADEAQRSCYDLVQKSASVGMNIIWDQTNLSKKVRKHRLNMLPAYYQKYFYLFPTPEPEELARRLASRPDKFIPKHIIENMIKNFEPPVIGQEGFIGQISG